LDAAIGIGRISPDGMMISYYSVPNSPYFITLGPDNNLWFTEPAANQIARITTDGTVSEFGRGTISEGAAPLGIAADENSTLWFTEEHRQDVIGRVDLSPGGTPTITEIQPEHVKTDGLTNITQLRSDPITISGSPYLSTIKSIR
jgi:streptogramin lyase